jgi:hypothetical protein
MTKLICRLLATVVLLGLVALEVHHDLVARVPWAGYDVKFNLIVFIMAPLWLLGAISLWVPRDLAWMGILTGVLAAFIHGIGVKIGGSMLGAVFIAAAPAFLLLAWYGRRPHPTTELFGPDREARDRARLELAYGR